MGEPAIIGRLDSQKPILPYAESSTDGWLECSDSLIIIHNRLSRFEYAGVATVLGVIVGLPMIKFLRDGQLTSPNEPAWMGWVLVISVLFLSYFLLAAIVSRPIIEIDLKTREATRDASLFRVNEMIRLDAFDRVSIGFEGWRRICTLKGPNGDWMLIHSRSKDETRRAANEIARRLNLPLVEE